MKPARHLLLARLVTMVACGARVPDPITAEAQKTGPGKVTIVEFVDYKCGFCRQQTDVLAEILERHAGQVRFVVKQVPLDKRHPGARRAARAAVCAEQQGKLEPVHADLMRAPDTSDETILEVARRAGLELEMFLACTRDPATDDRIQDDIDAFEACGGEGLPMLFVGGTKFVGLTDVDPIEKAMGEALDDVE